MHVHKQDWKVYNNSFSIAMHLEVYTALTVKCPFMCVRYLAIVKLESYRIVRTHDTEHS